MADPVACAEWIAIYAEHWFEKRQAGLDIRDAKDRRLISLIGTGGGVATAVAIQSLLFPFLSLVGFGVAGLNYVNYKKAVKDLAKARRDCLSAQRAMLEARSGIVTNCPTSDVPPTTEITDPCE